MNNEDKALYISAVITFLSMYSFLSYLIGNSFIEALINLSVSIISPILLFGFAYSLYKIILRILK